MLAKARSQGLILMENLDNVGALDQLPPTFGAMIAQELAQTRQGTAGALLLHSCVPVSEFSESWPTGIQVQIHGMDRDDFFLEDLPAAKELSQRDEAELFLYPGDQHLFTDSSLGAYDPEASALLISQVKELLAHIPTN